jgi:dTDP-glucose 4,6-dehydratase
LAARHSPRHVLLKQDICDTASIRAAFAEHQSDAVIHLAAESRVDRSTDDPRTFGQTNVIGTFVLLEAALDWRAAHDFERGLAATIDRYLHNRAWWEGILA